jgi:DNA-binding transcriptional regulator YiaG
MDAMTTKSSRRPQSLRQQLRSSMDDLRAIMARGQSPAGDGRFTVRTVDVIEPSVHDARSIRRARRSLNVSQALFARLLGVSGSLVRSWELGTRTPSPLARRLLDQVHANPAAFAALVRSSAGRPPRRARSQKVA